MADPLLQRIRALRQQPGIEQMRAELRRKQKLAEDTLLSLDNLISPLDWQDAGFGGYGAWRWGRPVDRTMDRTHAPLNYLNEQDWRWALAEARNLVQRNHLASGFRDHISAFVGPVSVSFVLRGQAPGAASVGDDGDAADSVDPLVKACTQCWEEWCELSDWGQGLHDREAECRRRLIVEGEATLMFFESDARNYGLPYARHVEPELIRTPPGHSTMDRHGWGVITGDDDDEDELGLWVCRYDNVSEGREVPFSEYVRIKANVDRTVKRGWSDFNPVGDQLRKIMGLLDNMAHVARLQAAIAWWEQYPTATAQQVSNMITAGADYSRTRIPPNATGAQTDVSNYEAGTVVRTEGGREVQPGPTAAPDGFAQVEQMVLRSIGFRWGCPSYFSGQSDDSFASVLVTGSPFVRITEARQEEVKGFARRVATRVLEFAERSGRLPRGASRRVRPVANAKPVVMADEEKQARTFLSLYDKNCADPVEFIRERGGDPKVVAANIRAWQKKFPPPQPNAPGAAGASPAGDVTTQDADATPPGSAGGDGTSPNEPDAADDPLSGLFGESESEHVWEANKDHPVGRPYQTTSGQWWVNKDVGGGKTRAVRTTDPNKGKSEPKAKAAPKAKPEPKPKPPTKAELAKQAKTQAAADKVKVKAAADKLAAGQELTADDVAHMDAHFQTLTQPEMKAVAKAIGEKISGAKKALGDRILAAARERLRAREKPPEPVKAPEPAAPEPEPVKTVQKAKSKPKPTPTAKPEPAKAPPAKAEPAVKKAPVPEGQQPVGEIEGGAIVGKNAAGELTTHFAPGQPEEQAQRLGGAIRAAMSDAQLFPEGEDGIVPLGLLVTLAKQKVSGATDSDVLAALSHLRKTRQIDTQALNETQKLVSKSPGTHALGGGKDLATATLWDNGRAVHYFQLPKS